MSYRETFQNLFETIRYLPSEEAPFLNDYFLVHHQEQSYLFSNKYPILKIMIGYLDPNPKTFGEKTIQLSKDQNFVVHNCHGPAYFVRSSPSFLSIDCQHYINGNFVSKTQFKENQQEYLRQEKVSSLKDKIDDL